MKRAASLLLIALALTALSMDSLRAEGRKFFINRAGQPLEVILTVRAGENVHQDAEEVSFRLDASASRVAVYGKRPEDIDLNAMEIRGENGCSMKQRVVRKGGVVDRRFNHNGAITFTKVHCLPISVPSPP